MGRKTPEQAAADTKRYQKAHPERMRARNAKYYARNREKVLARTARYNKDNHDTVYPRQAALYHKIKLRKYGLTPEDYDRMCAAQDGACAVCKKPETVTSRAGRTKKLAVDHCHITGRVRGLLCTRCNKALGCLGDGALLLAAHQYLARSAAQGHGTAIRRL